MLVAEENSKIYDTNTKGKNIQKLSSNFFRHQETKFGGGF